MSLNKPDNLALIMYVLVVVVGMIIVTIGEIFFDIKIRGENLALQWMIAYTIGQIYTSKYKQVILFSKKAVTS